MALALFVPLAGFSTTAATAFVAAPEPPLTGATRCVPAIVVMTPVPLAIVPPPSSTSYRFVPPDGAVRVGVIARPRVASVVAGIVASGCVGVVDDACQMRPCGNPV